MLRRSVYLMSHFTAGLKTTHVLDVQGEAFVYVRPTEHFPYSAQFVALGLHALKLTLFYAS